MRVSDALRVPAGPVDLQAIDPRSTPCLNAGKKAAEAQRTQRAQRLATLQEQLYAEAYTGGTRSVLLILQGVDTSGKGGTIKRALGGLNPSGVHVVSFRRPTLEEQRRDFLWRIRRQLPQPGIVGVFDRSHYEDVVTVRVRGLADERTWRQRYDAINRFEAEIADAGTTVVKCFLHISRDEQRERLLTRLDDPTKRWKFDPGDLDDRARFDDYIAAYADALERCSTEVAPWYVIPADRKWYRNWAVTQLMVERFEELGLQWPEPPYDVDEQRRRLLDMP